MIKTSLFAAAFGLLASVGFAQETVTFQASEIKPTAFKVKRAKAKGIELLPTPGIELTGEYFASSQGGKSPAVVILISGDGLQESHLGWAQHLADAGFATLVVDSFTSRGGYNAMDTPSVDFNDDAVSGYRYLTTRNDIDPDRIAVLGFSVGGAQVMSVTNQATARIPESFTPFAAVSMYPICPPDGVNKWPLMILAGDNDSMISLASCQSHVDQSQSQDHPATLEVFAGQTHFFDNPMYMEGGGLDMLGFTYDEAARKNALAKVTGYLQSQMALLN